MTRVQPAFHGYRVPLMAPGRAFCCPRPKKNGPAQLNFSVNRARYNHPAKPLDSVNNVEAIEIHHLVPGGDEIFDELRLRIGARIHF